VLKEWAAEDGTYDEQVTRRYLLSPYFESIGVACVQYDDEYYWVIEFGWK